MSIKIPPIVRPFACGGKSRLSARRPGSEVDVEQGLRGSAVNEGSKDGQPENFLHNPQSASRTASIWTPLSAASCGPAPRDLRLRSGIRLEAALRHTCKRNCGAQLFLHLSSHEHCQLQRRRVRQALKA